MINLASTSDLLQVVTSAGGDIAVHASWVDLVDAATTATPGRTNTLITTATTTTVVASPGASTKRNVKVLNVRNDHASTSNTITVRHTDGTTVVELFTCTLLFGEVLTVNDAGTWFVYDRFGGVKSGPSMVVDPTINDFRLSGVSATPVMTADSTTLGTIFLAQYKGGDIALFDGVNWQLATPASEVSLAVTGRTTDLPFDIFAFLSAGVVTLEFTNWSTASARVTGLTRVDGVWTKSGDATRRYLGSCRARSATTFHQVRIGTNLPCKFDLWNVDNRVAHGFTLTGTGVDYAYATAAFRQANASTNYQTDIMVGLQEESFEAVAAAMSLTATISIIRYTGIGVDSTTVPSGLRLAAQNDAAVTGPLVSQAMITDFPAIGRHFYAWLEFGGTGVTFRFNNNVANLGMSGMTGFWVC
jgi:hypothetical protein